VIEPSLAMLTRRRLIAFSATSALTPSVFGRAARAQMQPSTWPNRSVRLIVPLAAGGPTDSVARILAEQLSQKLDQQIVVDNRAGGGTNIGNEFVAHSEPDGYTVLYGTSSLAVNATLYRSLGYNPITDLAPVSLVAKFPFFMFVPNSSPAKTVTEFVAYVKAHQGKLVMGSPGTGSAPHLTEELFLQMAGIQMTHAPYRGAAPASSTSYQDALTAISAAANCLHTRGRARCAHWRRPAPREPPQSPNCRP
jgi:tripartite-type tricarboxylate transporter receptor subunit TctC